MEEICAHCDKKANYSCLCTDPQSYLCKVHIDYHECLPGDHSFKTLVQKSNPINISSKTTLIAKILEVRLEAKSQKKLITTNWLDLMRKLSSQAKSNLNRLNSFIQICEDVIKEVSSITLIPLKATYSPLETVLLSAEITMIVGKISAPKVNIPNTSVDISYSPSNFPSFLYSYSDIQIYCYDKCLDVARANLRQEKIQHALSGAACLNVGINKVILCAEKQAFYLDLNDRSIIKIPPMINSRINHTMTWIEGYPAAIGGNNDTSNLIEVEIFKDNTWIEISPINLGKHSLASTCSHKNAWVIGDIPWSAPNIKSIEVYDKKIWKIIHFTLPTLPSQIGFCCIEATLLLFSEAKLYILDTKHKSVIGEIMNNPQRLNPMNMQNQPFGGGIFKESFPRNKFESSSFGFANSFTSFNQTIIWTNDAVKRDTPLNSNQSKIIPNSISRQFEVQRDTISSFHYFINTTDIKIA